MLLRLRSCTLSILAIGATLGLVSGCTTNPYTGQEQMSRTAIGAGAGAAGGALLGQLVGGNTTGTLIGAGLGALAGGAIGGYMDHQNAELRRQLAGTGVQVVQQGNNVRLIMPGDIVFPLNGSQINPQFYNTLYSVALVLKKYNKTLIRVVGFTDNIGRAEYNQELSERRAQSVANYLVSQGVNPNRFSVVGYGARYPVASNSTPAGQAANRRVEININQIN